MEAGDPVFSPCDGLVVIAAADISRPNVIDRIVINCGCGYYVGLHHIVPSILDGRVLIGQQVGEIDTGPPDPNFTPHLHIELEDINQLRGCVYQGDIGCPIDIMTSGLWSKNALEELYKMPEVRGYGIP